MTQEPLLSVGRLPVFDLASGFLFLIGLNAYRKKIKLDRTRIMLVIALIALLFGALEQALIGIIVLLPFAFSIIAAGIEYLLDEWYRVFPRNPFAKSFGIIAITAVVLFSSYYQMTRFLVVWPHAPETRETYDLKRSIE